MKPLILFLCLLVLAGCNNSKSDITSIEFAKSWDFGPSQHLAIKIDSSLNYQFYGGEALHMDTNHVLKGYYSGKISKSLWDTLTDDLNQIDYKHLKKKLMSLDRNPKSSELSLLWNRD
ncbi:hypothetical protein JN11_04839 [Mucilaginibacter frigoritolerans]|uniref:Uncharacterized protein n=1 Tax=Mucilaginibacter frigoritolerans TaxID=652788 RepID=A0A562TKM1_9SPHI|nr:DUF6438 domain-containing protein [Mucilaginibacter frigoritolerans]TWI94022.1 hypothetical protein JN11_04839 [Mucilaginibacter frigoritolerans]